MFHNIFYCCFIIKKIINKINLKLNGHLILGIGLGIIITSIVIFPFFGKTSRAKIEIEARKMGMIYKDEVKVMD